MTSLIERMQRSRERWLELKDGRALLLRRPTVTKLMDLSRGDREELVRQCLIGWRGFTEADVLPGGGSFQCDFALDVAVEWLLDRPQVFAEVIDDLHARVLEFVGATEADRKN